MTDASTATSRPDRKLNAIGEVERVRPVALAAVRIIVSFLFICHGFQGMFGTFGGIDGHGTAVAIGSWPGWWASAIHLIGGALVFLGLLTPSAALVCSGAMAYAYFSVHQPMGLLPLQNNGELAALYCWIFLLIAILGPGSFALDNLLRRIRTGDHRG